MPGAFGQSALSAPPGEVGIWESSALAWLAGSWVGGSDPPLTDSAAVMREREREREDILIVCHVIDRHDMYGTILIKKYQGKTRALQSTYPACSAAIVVYHIEYWIWIEALHSEVKLYALHDMATLTHIKVSMCSQVTSHMEWVQSVNHRHAEQKMHDL